MTLNIILAVIVLSQSIAIATLLKKRSRPKRHRLSEDERATMSAINTINSERQALRAMLGGNASRLTNGAAVVLQQRR